ncbi:hypothetical protein CONCODRAFT_12809 [Conidiobolus coronatus NRRL 28638]|uniref:Uncharacterized protein n=1 Tax=Conidiobolus coronatus (strain ATCC 28846 / CBS 209.66 / NRRL 28638) TaxID=796925 RepID=A0A137NS60_CONC2|nr:hypothetical protein CONCODRAFT_12809 [Conidiobolus coronatus NRRL 28638]|eukprot:KXN65564.1 hypothetical protein CONCODRAFT_12809 [Conidiobolus coronatus NRRL 28638]
MKFLIALTTVTTAILAAPTPQLPGLLGIGGLADGLLNNGHLAHILPLGDLTNDLTNTLSGLDYIFNTLTLIQVSQNTKALMVVKGL